MTYSKPENVTYTDMAIWIDEHVYSNCRNDDLIYQYCYHLSVMLARRMNFYKTAAELDTFGLYCATRLHLRLVNPKQAEDPQKGQLKKIKSVLNYLKNVIGCYKVDFEYLHSVESKDYDTIEMPEFNLVDYSQLYTDPFDQLDFSIALNSISSIVKSHLKKIPHKKYSTEWNNIYLSCMLTLINSITLPESVLQETLTEGQLERFYSNEKYSEPVMYHLPECYKNYIITLVNELRHVIASELRLQTHCYGTTDQLITDVMISAHGILHEDKD